LPRNSEFFIAPLDLEKLRSQKLIDLYEFMKLKIFFKGEGHNPSERSFIEANLLIESDKDVIVRVESTIRGLNQL
jgi:hypothetical protein